MPTDHGELYEEIWNRFLERYRAFTSAIDAIRATERQGTGLETPLLAFCDMRCEDPEDKARAIVDALRRIAETHFAPGNMRMEIDYETMQTAYDTARLRPRERNFDPDAFSPAAVWMVFENAYGGTQGADAAHTQAADDLAARLRLSPDTPIKRVKGRPCLSVSIFTDDFGGRPTLGVRTGQEIVTIFRRFGEVADYLGYDVHCMYGAAQDWTHAPHREVKSRARYHYGLIELVTYKTRFEFRLEPEFAAGLQAFLGDYATRFREVA